MPIVTNNKLYFGEPTKRLIYCFSTCIKARQEIDTEAREATGVFEEYIFIQGANVSTGEVIEGEDNTITRLYPKDFVPSEFYKDNIVLYGDPNMNPADKPTFEDVRTFYFETKRQLATACIVNRLPEPTEDDVIKLLVAKYGQGYTLPEQFVVRHNIEEKDGHGVK